jgi:anaerobic ribonucleoside-triphosphate reductase activating protein
MRLALSRVHFPVTTLGPGRRVGIWFQGCSIRCLGCISADTWAKREPDLNVAELIQSSHVWLSECDGVTISGGEPFEQPEALAELLRLIRTDYDCDVLVYSGLSFEGLKDHPLVLSGLIDALISEPYLQDEAQTKPLRGSDNQCLHFLTERGLAQFSRFDRTDEQPEKSLDVMFDATGTVWLAGIPRRGDMRRLQGILAAQGDVITITEARS